jgi:Ca2+-binding EF-hand superfamily protein
MKLWAFLLSGALLGADDPQPVRSRVVLAAQQQTAVVARSMNYGPTPVREEVDPQDTVERVLLLSPGGPLVIELTLTIDGQPFNVPREALVDELLEDADTDQDDKPTWKEAMENPRFGFGRLAQIVSIGQTREQRIAQLTQQYDVNRNGLVDRSEARGFLAQMFGGPAFTLSGQVAYARIGGYGVGPPAGQPTVVRELLDTDGDGILSPDELAAATQKLETRDADGNELVTLAELAGESAPDPLAARRLVIGGTSSLIYLLGPAVRLEQLDSALRQKYGQELKSDAFPLVPNLLPALDANQNGRLERDELAGLNTISPHIALAANFGRMGDVPGGIMVTSVSQELGDFELAPARGRRSLQLAGLQLEFTIPPSPAARINYDAQAMAYLNRFDTDKNGYLEKQELADNNRPFAQQFEAWDTDGDGKVYAAELKTFFERQAAPSRSQIAATVDTPKDPLLTTLDTSGDERLSLRELRSAPTRLAALDKNADGRLDMQEVPAQMSVTLSHGGTGYRYYPAPVVGYSASVSRPTAPASGPEWFQRMDRNGDGDVSPREFLGSRDQFQRLDADADGLIDAQEAAARM